jgi:hypothetical protein
MRFIRAEADVKAIGRGDVSGIRLQVLSASDSDRAVEATEPLVGLYSTDDDPELGEEVRLRLRDLLDTLAEAQAADPSLFETMPFHLAESTVEEPSPRDQLRDDEIFVRHDESLSWPMAPGECTVWRQIEGGYGVSGERRHDNVVRRYINRDGSEATITMDLR